jgi:hypothetical protein
VSEVVGLNTALDFDRHAMEMEQTMEHMMTPTGRN